MNLLSPSALLHIDTMSVAMMMVVGTIGALVALFSKNYLQGDRRYGAFFLQLILLMASVFMISMADHLILFLGAWFLCNDTLSRMITHKSTWAAARASGTVAWLYFMLGMGFLTASFSMLYYTTGSLSIQEIIQKPMGSWPTILALLGILVAAMIQSALCPFHRWLISSVNAPTPVSALMHAGVVNGGGFLLLRFAPLYATHIPFMNTIFIVGLLSTLVGSFWKMMQNDIKRMLACSTIGQMGFMFVQLGLGLFSAALAHICWHGLFKAYLFLSSGNTGKEKRKDLGHYPHVLTMALSALNASLSTFLFAHLSHHTQWDASILILGIVWISSAQLSLSILSIHPIKRAPFALMIGTLFSGLYGVTVRSFDHLSSSLWPTLSPIPVQNLRGIHILALGILVLVWMMVLFLKYDKKTRFFPNWVLFLYVKMLNASQPYPQTTTDNRKGYDYV